MKKIILVLIIISLLFTVSGNLFAVNGNSVVITINNSLPFPTYKVVSFSYTFKAPVLQDTKFALFDKGKELPLQIVSIRSNTVNFKTVLNLKPSASEILILKFGKNIKTNYKNIFAPNFSGTKFVGIGSGELFIVSLKDENNIKVTDDSGKVLFTGKLNKKSIKIIPLPGRDTVFSITSSFPIFAEVSSLKSNCLKNSSDDVSSVFGTYFILYVPKEIIVSSYTTTHLNMKTLSGKTICSQVLLPRGQYKNFDLQPGFYEISTDNPVTIQFGCEDDNIYAINYGSLDSFKGVSYGNIVCSALFPNTKIQIKTASKTYPKAILQKRGDYIYKDIITTFEDNKTEAAPVYVTYNNPILIYSDANHGNIGGEQIPSVYGNGKVFSFLTGKIFNFDGLTHRRKVAIIPSENNTSITINGKKIVLQKALVPKIYLFSKSYTPVGIISNKPIAVFDIGMGTSIEFFAMLLPIQDNNSFSVAVSKAGQAPSSGNGTNNKNAKISESGRWLSALGKYISPVGAFFVDMFNNARKISGVKNVFNTLEEFGASVSPYLKSLSKQIIDLFMPASEMIYPSIHMYLPNLSKEQIAAIIFYVLVVFIIILLIPKRRKKKLPVIKVKEEKEIKKKNRLAFNVKTIEEKSIGVKYGAIGKPKTLTLEKRILQKEGSSPGKAVNLPTQAPPFKRSSVKPLEISEKPKELGAQISALYKRPGVSPSVDKLETEKKPSHIVEEKKLAEKSQKLIKKEEVVQNAKRSAIKEIKEELGKSSVALPKQAHIEEKPKGSQQIIDKTGITKETPAKEGKFKEKEVTGQSKFEVPIVKKEEKKAESSFTKLFKREENISSSEVSKKQAKETSKDVRKQEIEKTSNEEISMHTSLDELLARVEETGIGSSVHKETEEITKGGEVTSFEEVPIHKEKETEKLGTFGIRAGSSIVLDKDSVEVLVRRDLMKHMGRIFISAKEQTMIDPDIKERYRLGVISLTPIELRIAEDIARRIKAKISTGEVLLIAKKVGVKQILVNDDPKIKEYQGIKIINVQSIESD